MLSAARCASQVLVMLMFWCTSAIAVSPISILPSTHVLSLMVKEVTGDKHEPLLSTNVSPHDFSLKPSHVRRLQKAELVVWFGPAIEPYLAKVMRQIPDDKQLIINQDLSASNYGGHPWTSPGYLLQGMQQLRQYTGQAWNSQEWVQQMIQLKVELAASTRDMSQKNQGYLVYHDGISAFETYFGLTHLASFTNADDQPPGAQQLAIIAQLDKDDKVACILMDHEAQPKLVNAVIKSSVERIQIDILATKSHSLLVYLTRLQKALLGCGHR